jgi:nucleotide-binding universal stress UspA family protein
MFNISKILVPVDFSECSRAALSHALSLAEQHGATIEALHVAEVPSLRGELRVATESGTTSFREYALGAAQIELAGFLSGLSSAERARISSRVEVGRPRERILDRAEHERYDLIVMGTHGRTGRAHLLAGSVAESVVRSAPCPVLTVRGPQ